MANKPYCIDIYQGNTVLGANDEGFAQVKAAGIAFLDHKASQGAAEVDRLCAFRRAKWMDGNPVAVTDIDGTILQIPPKFGFYHFNGGAAASTEAAHFIATVKSQGWQSGDDLCLDWEDIGASGTQMSATWADQFCDAVEQWCGFPIKVYGGDAPREQLARASDALIAKFAARRLWFCQYGAFQGGLIPKPWHNQPYQWQDDGDQYGPGPHTIAGLTGYCDNSTVVGSMTVTKLAAGWGGGLGATS